MYSFMGAFHAGGTISAGPYSTPPTSGSVIPLTSPISLHFTDASSVQIPTPPTPGASWVNTFGMFPLAIVAGLLVTLAVFVMVMIWRTMMDNDCADFAPAAMAGYITVMLGSIGFTVSAMQNYVGMIGLLLPVILGVIPGVLTYRVAWLTIIMGDTIGDNKLYNRDRRRAIRHAVVIGSDAALVAHFNEYTSYTVVYEQSNRPA